MSGAHFRIGITSNAGAVADLLDEIGAKIEEQCRIAAANKTAVAIQRQVKKEIRARLGVPEAAMAARMKLYRARPKRTTARVFVGTVPISVAKMGAKPLKRGVSWPGGAAGRQRSPNAFFIKMARNGQPGVFVRRGDARLPIDKITVEVYPTASAVSRELVRTMGPALFNPAYKAEWEKRVNAAVKRRRL